MAGVSKSKWALFDLRTIARYSRFLFVSMVAALLSACATPPKPQAGSDAADAFSRTGRFAVTVTDADGRQKAVQGGFSWLDHNGHYLLDLTNPLGSIEARVEGGPDAASLTKADGTRLQASDPDTLAQEALGYPVPVAGMRYWLRGRVPAGAEPTALTLDAHGRPASFTQDEWHATFSRYDALGPQLLVLERLEPGRRTLLRIVVHNP